MGIKILQLNVDRKRSSHDMLWHAAQDRKEDLLLVAEPNKKLAKEKGWFVDEWIDAAVIKVSKTLKIAEWGKGNGFVWIKTNDIVIYSCYFSPNRSCEFFDEFLSDIGRDIRHEVGHAILGGDFNAKSPMWGASREDKRGKILADWAMGKGLVVLNKGDRRTFQRGTGESFIDITLADDQLFRKILGWQVLELETLCWHNLIEYKIRLGPESCNKEYTRSIGKLDIGRCRELIRDAPEWTDGNLDIFGCLAISTRTDERGNPVYWWTAEIAECKTSTGEGS